MGRIEVGVNQSGGGGEGGDRVLVGLWEGGV